MKIRNLLAIAVLTVSIVTVGCKKDEKESGSNIGASAGSITVGSNTYKLSGAVGYDYGASGWHDGYNIDLIVYSEGVTVVGDTAFTGTGALIYLESFSNLASDLAPGTYSFNDDQYPVFSFSDASLTYQGNVQDLSGTRLETTGGTYALSKDGSTYTIVFNLDLENGSKATGTYTGPINIQ